MSVLSEKDARQRTHIANELNGKAGMERYIIFMVSEI